MNWANRLTISRLALTVLFVAMLNISSPYARTTAFIIFLIAGVTDFVDGEIARRYRIVTNFGKLMDPLVDKIMMAAAFISLVPMGAIPAWAATTVVGREFLITGLRLMASARGQVLPAERLGKHKTSWQIITVMICHEVLCFPKRSAGNTCPRALAIRRSPVIKNSRPTTVVAAQAGIAPIGTSEINAAAIMILYTSGSMSLPKFVTIR